MCQRTFQLVRHRIQPASLPGLTPCGCEEEHPPLHKRRCLDLVLTSFNCQSMSNRAFHLLCESKCNAFWLPWNSRQQASLRESQSFSPPGIGQASHCFCLLFIRFRLTRRMSMAGFHIAAGIAHVKIERLRICHICQSLCFVVEMKNKKQCKLNVHSTVAKEPGFI